MMGSLLIYNHSAKRDLQSLIDTDVDEAVYTTSSYQNYAYALQKASSVRKNPFVFPGAVHQSQADLQQAIDNLQPASLGLYKIDYRFTLDFNDHVGQNWETSLSYNGAPFDSGAAFIASFDSLALIEYSVTECDLIPDSTSGAIRIILRDASTFTEQIKISENRGLYSGNIAIWNLECSVHLIERI